MIWRKVRHRRSEQILEQMEKNYLGAVVAVVLAAMLVLLGLYWLPTIKVDDWQMRKVDILADIRNDSALQVLTTTDSIATDDATDSTSTQMAHGGVPVLTGSHLVRTKDGRLITAEDSIINARQQATASRDGITSIIDMSDGAPGGMAAFYHALAQAQGRPVRIAVLGDSYIEGDILTSKLRELLQQRFGGTGCGYLPMTSITANFRRTVKQTFNGWLQHKAVDRNGYADAFNNLTGNYFTANNGAWVNIIGNGNFYSSSATCTSSSFYFLGNGSTGYATAVVNGTDTTHFALTNAGVVSHARVSGDIKSVKWTVSDPAETIFLGTSMDSDNGVIVDNFAMRSASGKHLSRISPSMLSAFNQVRHYDLVILMYGLNIASSTQSAYTGYCNLISAAVKNIKTGMPGTSVLVVGCSDRAERTANGWRTMPGVLGLIQAQKRVAINNGVAFWDLREAMGGEGSIVRMVQRGEANSDYTHINFKGGDHLARLLYDAIILGFETR